MGSSAISKWAEGFGIECVWEHGSETKGWRRSDGERAIETNGDPIWEHDDGFAEAWEARGAKVKYWLQYLNRDGQWDYPGDPDACAFDSDDEARSAIAGLEDPDIGYGDVAAWRVVPSETYPRGDASYAEQERAKAHYASQEA